MSSSSPEPSPIFRHLSLVPALDHIVKTPLDVQPRTTVTRQRT
jgi:hypothetical protein